MAMIVPDDRAALDLLVSAIDEVRLGIVVFDADVRVLLANRFAQEHLGLATSPEWTPHDSSLFFADADDFTDAVRRCAAGTEIIPRSRAVVDAGGGHVHLQCNMRRLTDGAGGTRGVIVAWRDVTTEAHVAEALRWSDDFARVLMDTTGAFVVVIDASGTIVRLNAAWETVGVDPARIVGQNMLTGEVVPIEQRALVRSMFDELVGERRRSFELDLPLPSGVRRRLVWTTSTLRDDAGDVVTVVATGIDVTDQRLLEKRVEEVGRQEAIVRFATGIAHDFGNTLSALRIRTEHLRELDGRSPERDLDAMVRAMDTGQRLVADLMALGRPTVASARTHPDPVVTRAFGWLSEMLGDDVELDLRLGAGDRTIAMAGETFERCIANLVINAKDAMPNGGRLTVRTECRTVGEDDIVTLSPSVQPGEYVVASITDTGVGVSEHALPRLFEPYFSSKPASRGTGLGLTIVYGAVTQAGGVLTVESSVGAGSTFSMWLP